MSLIKLLQEASSLKLADLKKAIKKDKRASQILDKNLSLSDIRDIDGFIATLKYYFFNNQEVRDFIATRHDIKEVNKREFDELRKKQAKDITQDDLNQIADLINIVFKEFSAVDRGSMSADLKKELRDWINRSGRFYNLPTWAVKELKSIPSIRPNKRVMLYRGVLFNSSDLSSREKYDGSLEVGNGLKFLKSIREGGREVDLKWDRPSSWTTDKSIAIQFAKYGPASSQFSAMLGWFDREMKKQAIDGALGYVIATFADPEDILIDTHRAAISGTTHGDEGEMILAPGEYLARVIHKFTVEGEVDPSMSKVAHEDTPVFKALEATKEMARTFKLEDIVDLKASDIKQHMWSSNSIRILSNMPMFKKLILNSATTSVTHALDKLLAFYKENLDYLRDEDLRADKYATDEDLRSKVQDLNKIMRVFRDEISHSKLKTDKNPKAKGKMHMLTGEEYRTTIKCYDLVEIEKQLLLTGRITDHAGESAIKELAKQVGVKVETNRLAQMGAGKQKPIIEEIVSAFYDKTGVDKPTDFNESVKMMLNLIRKAYRNYDILQKLENLQEQIRDLK